MSTNYCEGPSMLFHRVREATIMIASDIYTEKFPPHGHFDVSLEDNILVIDAFGPFNEQAVHNYESKLKQILNDLEGKQWSQITIVHGFSLGTGIAEKELTESIKYRKSIGLEAAAVVLENVEGLSLMKTQLGRCYVECGIPFKFFEEFSIAKNWLNEQNC